MKILVTGGSGFVGSHLIRFLLQETNHRIINIDSLTYASNLILHSELRNETRLEFEKADIIDGDVVSTLISKHRPDAIMHLAAESHVDRSISGPSAFIQTNIVGTFNLLHAANKYYEGIDGEAKDLFRFLHVSTDEVYGSLGLTDPSFNESTPYSPRSPYSASKASSDHLVRAWHATYGLPVLITHSSNNYGPAQYPEKLIPLVIHRAVAGTEIPVYGDGENVRDWVHVKDHARALHCVLKDGRIGETYNVAGNNELKNLELVNSICKLLDELVPQSKNQNLRNKNLSSYTDLITFIPDRAGHDLRYSLNDTKIRRELGWAPIENFEQGLRKTIRWYLSELGQL